MFSKILIANRGEIAVRVIRACRALGVRAAAVYSEADREALHVRMADEAVFAGPAAPAESYLDAERMVRAARDCGAEAVHPGYGFLAEDADFAEACEGAGLVFIGPSPAVLRSAGDKLAAREAAGRAGLPVLPAAGLEGVDEEFRRREAERMGYPLLVKAAVGGGGRGMRRAAGPGDLEEACRGARAEAEAAFGDGRVFLEKLLPGARHVEVQILGDGEGGAIHLGERECSLQRRHQKVIEESPASFLEEGVRGAICGGAVRLAGALRYRGAGTVEFLLDGGGDFYFLEVNARLQVEHPVTEMVTGRDLVALQLAVSAGGGLPLAQEEVRFAGHAAEARLYAEDPARAFLPQAGRVRAVRWPGGPGVRVDAGVEAGSAVGAEYDPLLAKVIAWGADRGAALSRLGGALEELRLTGLRTNQSFLLEVIRHPAFLAGGVSTDFVSAHPEVLDPPFPEERLADARLAAALALHLEEAEGGGGGEGGGRPAGGGGHGAPVRPGGLDPWDRAGGWLPGGLA